MYDHKSFADGCGSMITIDMGTQEKAFKFLMQSKLLTLTANIGDCRSLGSSYGKYNLPRFYMIKKKSF